MAFVSRGGAKFIRGMTPHPLAPRLALSTLGAPLGLLTVSRLSAQTSGLFHCKIRDGLELRSVEFADAAELFALVDSDREHLRRWLPWVDGSRSVEDTRVFIDGAMRQAEEGDGFTATIRCEGEIAGIIGHHRIDWPNRLGKLGYWLGSRFVGRGLMTQSCRAVVAHAFESIGLNRIEIHCATQNVRSRAVPERLEFRHEGTRREAEWLYDHFVDLECYAMLASERERLNG